MKFLRKLISPKALIAIAIALVVGHLIDPSIAFAAGDSNETLKAFAQLFSILVNIFTFLSLIFLNYGGDLVGTEFLTASEPMEAIRPMWVIIRNITNVGFVLVLLFLAFSNLFSSFSEGGSWTIKEKLPKVIFALIAINFSLLGFKVILDAVHIGTITIFSIPDSTLRDKGVGKLEDMLKIPVDIPSNSENGTPTKAPFYTVINDLMCGEGKWDTNGDEKVREVLPTDCLFAVDPFREGIGKSRSDAAHNLFLAFGIQFNKLQNLPSLAAKMNDWSDVITSVLFVSILSLAQVIALGAVFIALIIRVVVLWIAMVFSPFLIAASIMGFDGDGGKIGSQVISNIIMPLKIAAAFAVSFLMMDTMINIGGPNTDFIRVGSSISTFGSTGYGLLWSIATIVVFWKAAFWAMEGSAGEAIINKIKSGAEGAGGFLARAGTIDREFFPMPGVGEDGKVAFSTLFKAGTSGMVEAHRNIMNKDEQSVFEKLGIRSGADTKTHTEIKTELDSTNNMGEEALINFLKKYGLKAFRDNQNLTKQLYNSLSEGMQKRYGKDEGKFVAELQKALPDGTAFLSTGADKKQDFLGLRETGTATGDKEKSKEKAEGTFFYVDGDDIYLKNSAGKEKAFNLEKVKEQTTIADKLTALNSKIGDSLKDQGYRDKLGGKELEDVLGAIGIKKAERGNYEIREAEAGKGNWIVVEKPAETKTPLAEEPKADAGTGTGTG